MRASRFLRPVVAGLLCLLLGSVAHAQASRPAAAGFDVEAATQAYLARVPPDVQARSDAYFEGGYWLLLWDFLLYAGISLLILSRGWSAAMRERARRLTRFRFLQAWAYWVQYLVLATVLGAPLAIYDGFVREHQYGLSNLSFGAWLGEEGIALCVAIVLGGMFVGGLLGLVRRLGDRWWAWGSVFAVLAMAFGQMIAPVFVLPLFNEYTRLEDQRIVAPIVRMARANGMEAKDVFQVDASKQTKRVSANVAGLLGTERIALNDNLIQRCTLPQIESVLGHEIGHYVLNHSFEGLMFFGFLITLGFVFLHRVGGRLLSRYGARWGIEGYSDPAVVPLAAALLSAYFFVLTPVINSFVRMLETEADLYGLNAAGQPDARAEVILLHVEYRKLSPGPLEEMLFYDHPSPRTRIRMAMRFKAERLAAQGASSPE